MNLFEFSDPLDPIVQYFLFAGSIEETVHSRFANARQAFRAFGESITSYTYTTGKKFPFLTVDLFEVDASNARERSGVESLGILPYLQESELAAWGNYSVEHGSAWLEQSRVSNIAICCASFFRSSQPKLRLSA